MSDKHPKTKQTSSAGKTILTGPLVSKAFVLKNGKKTDKEELYLRASVQDYFIKFCESKVSQKELEKHLKTVTQTDPMGDKIVSLAVDIINKGEWDNCEGADMQVQSRIGTYIIIHSIE